MSMSRTATQAAVALVAVLVVVPVLFALHVARTGPQLRQVEVGISGPVLVAQVVAERADALPGGPVEAVVIDEDTDPSAPVRDGRLAAVVAIDFRDDVDVLHASPVTDPDLVADLRVRAEAISSTYGRSVRVDLVAPARSSGSWRGTPYVMVVAWMVLGVVWSVGLSAWRGPVAPTARRAVRRLAGLAGLSLVSGLAVAVVAAASSDATLLLPTLVGALTVAATAWLVLGLEALFGLAGLGVAVSLLLATAVPLVGLDEPASLPRPWSDLVPATPPGAALTLVRDDVFFGAGVGLRPVAVLASWALVGVLTLAVARRERAGVEHGSGAEM